MAIDKTQLNEKTRPNDANGQLDNDNGVNDQSIADLNNPTPEPPEVSKAKLRKNAEESAKLDSPQRTNDSTIEPNKPKEKILEGFHGG
jgi:hypothetical protein